MTKMVPYRSKNSYHGNRGDMMDYAAQTYEESQECSDGSIDWRENVPFSGTMRLLGVERGRSAVGFILKNEHDSKFLIRIKMMVDLLKIATVSAGVVSGRWDIVKQGANYSLRYLGA